MKKYGSGDGSMSGPIKDLSEPVKEEEKETEEESKDSEEQFMKYYLVSGDNSSAVIGQDYVNSLFTFRSNSQYLTAAIDCCKSTVKGGALYKSSDSTVKISKMDETNPSFLTKVVDKLTSSDFWKIKDQGEFVDIAEFEEYSSSTLQAFFQLLQNPDTYITYTY